MFAFIISLVEMCHDDSSEYLQIVSVSLHFGLDRVCC